MSDIFDPNEKKRLQDKFFRNKEEKKEQAKAENASAIERKKRYEMLRPPDMPVKMPSEAEKDYKKRLEEWMQRHRDAFLNAMEDPEKKERFSKTCVVEDGKLVFKGENGLEALAEYLKLNPGAKFDIAFDEGPDGRIMAVQEIQQMMKLEQSMNMQGMLLQSVYSMSFNENGQKVTLSGPALQDFIGKVRAQAEMDLKTPEVQEPPKGELGEGEGKKARNPWDPRIPKTPRPGE